MQETTNLFKRMTRPLKVTREYLPAEDEIHAAQLQQLMMTEALAGISDKLSVDTVASYLDNSRLWNVSAAVALFPLWIFDTNFCAYQSLSTDELKHFAANCEAMFAGEKFYYNDGCGIDAGAGEADTPKDLLWISLSFSLYQGGYDEPGEAERVLRTFKDAGFLTEQEFEKRLAEHNEYVAD